jgi:hypothetical protein
VADQVALGFDANGRLVQAENGDTLVDVAGNPIGGTAGGGGSFVGWEAYKTSAQLIGTGSIPVTFDAEIFDTNSFHDNVTNNDRFTIPSGQGGTYLVIVNVSWAAAVSDNPHLTLIEVINSGGGLVSQHLDARRNVNNAAVGSAYSSIAQLAASPTDYFRISVLQEVNLGGSSNLVTCRCFGMKLF